MKLNEYLLIIEKFIINYLNESHSQGYVLGLSGGIDSSLVAALTKKAVGDKLFTVMIPIESDESDLKDALTLAKDFSLNYVIIDATDIYHSYLNNFQKLGIELDTATKGNLKVRIRMSILYAIAQKRSSLVIGTDNKDERYVGYFTKYGDGGVDLLPIAKLTKREVKEAAKILGVRDSLINKVPSAGLFTGQTDEGEMKIKYDVLDDFLIGKDIDEISKDRINYLHKISNHKRIAIPEPEEFIRDENKN